MPSQSTAVATVDDEEGIETVTITIFKEKFKVLKVNNFFNVLRAFDEEAPANLPKFMINAIAREDRARFITLMAQQQDLTNDDLFEIFADIMEAQAEGRPTTQSQGSRTSSRTKRA